MTTTNSPRFIYEVATLGMNGEVSRFFYADEGSAIQAAKRSAVECGNACTPAQELRVVSWSADELKLSLSGAPAQVMARCVRHAVL